MSANRLSHLFETAPINWADIIVSPDYGTRLKFDFPLLPEHFLEFAQADLDAGGMRGYINSLSNAKRAMDCRVESIIAAIGYTASGLRTQLGKNIVAMIEKEASDSSLPFTYKFFESLGGFTPSLLDRVRRLRHDVEHRFQKPTKRKAVEVLEIAELFVRSTEGLVSGIVEAYSFGSELTKRSDGYSWDCANQFYVSFEFSGEQSKADVRLWQMSVINGSEAPCTDVFPRHPSYYWLVRLAFALGRDHDAQPLIRGLVSSSGAKIPMRGIKVVGFY